MSVSNVSLGDFKNLVITTTDSTNNVMLDSDSGKLTATKQAQATDGAAVIKTLRESAKGTGYSDAQIDDALKALPEGKKITVADLKQVLDKLDVMSRAAFPLDIDAILIALAITGLNLRKTAQEAAQQAGLNQIQSIKNQADRMASAAGWALAASVVSGSFQMMSGFTTMASAGLSAASGFKTDAAIAGGKIIGQGGEGASQFIGGAGKIIEAGLNYKSQLEQAEVTKEKAEETKYATERETQLKFTENAQGLIQATQEALKQVIEARGQMTQKILA